jgi:hypothetical protein
MPDPGGVPSNARTTRTRRLGRHRDDGKGAASDVEWRGLDYVGAADEGRATPALAARLPATRCRRTPSCEALPYGDAANRRTRLLSLPLAAMCTAGENGIRARRPQACIESCADLESCGDRRRSSRSAGSLTGVLVTLAFCRSGWRLASGPHPSQKMSPAKDIARTGIRAWFSVETQRGPASCDLRSGDHALGS